MHITIIRRPLGDAPEWVRDAWIGMRLPTVQSTESSWEVVSVLTGPLPALSQWWDAIRGRVNHMTGYAVRVDVAVGLLAEKDAAAAHWWEKNTPGMIERGDTFIFDSAACRASKP